MHKINIKRIYDKPFKTDGVRILVDRLWPRGISKDKAKLDFWEKEIAPSSELRVWFGHKPERFEEFAKKYREELTLHLDKIKKIKKVLNSHNITLLYAAKDTKNNQAIILKDFIENIKSGAKDAKLELLCKIFIDKLTSESILYIDFALSEYQKIKNVA